MARTATYVRTVYLVGANVDGTLVFGIDFHYPYIGPLPLFESREQKNWQPCSRGSFDVRTVPRRKRIKTVNHRD
jgi:hypothetical protein